jgi:D-arabinose 5-phosphate isomerase GutQ
LAIAAEKTTCNKSEVAQSGVAQSEVAQSGGTKSNGTEFDRNRAIATGRRVMATEAAALGLFVGQLGDAFADAIEVMLSAKGRVIVSGMGKSGHVGRKIAATMASTGTPAQFVHPAEASHGDLGMVTRDDVVLVLSNSGETKELADIVAHTRRYAIPLVGVASRPGSTLLKAADIALTLPQAPEACSVGLAPTTSTTLTLALGDALAVALMERRDFTPERFADFHPGGKLGARHRHRWQADRGDHRWRSAAQHGRVAGTHRSRCRHARTAHDRPWPAGAGGIGADERPQYHLPVRLGWRHPGPAIGHRAYA